MRKRFNVCLVMPVTVDVMAERKGEDGELNIIDVFNVTLPAVSDIRDSSSDDNLDAIEEAFEDAQELQE